MNDIRILLSAVNINIFHAEALCKEHIYLDRYQSIFLAEYVLVLDIELRTIECSLVDTDGIFNAKVLKDSLHGSLSVFPLLGSTLVLVLGVSGIPLGESECAVLKKSYSAKEVLCKLQAASELVLQLLGTNNVVTLGMVNCLTLIRPCISPLSSFLNSVEVSVSLMGRSR